MDTHAVVWIGTNGRFCIVSHQNKHAAEVHARMTNESGLPAVIITRQEVIDGDFKSNAQLEEAEDANSS
jgi:hypothetical protein